MEYIKLFATEAEQNAFRQSSDYAEPHVSWCEDMEEVKYNKTAEEWANEYFTTIALEDGTISFNIRFDMGTDMIKSISYSTDDGETWNTTNNVNDKEENLVINVNVSKGNKILWKGNTTQFGYGDYGDVIGSFFSSTCEFDVQGNIMSLLYGDDFKGKTTIENEEAFASLFCVDDGREKVCKIVNAKNLSLPATTLTNACYHWMFQGCTSLTTAPELPATTLANSCYYGMFYNCTSLITAPVLPATTLASNCYNGMFYNCTSLTTAPVLPVTTLAESCYSDMFSNCTSLTTAPELPATTLVNYCYLNMFEGCTSLTSAPQLPATSLADSCYSRMFERCTSLTTAPQLPATILTDYCYFNMFANCTSLTTVPLVLPAMTLANYCYQEMFLGCTSLTTAPELPAMTLANYCYTGMFNSCTSLIIAPKLPATTLVDGCYCYMFQNCTSLTTAPELPATTLAGSCYKRMFTGCVRLNYIKAMFTTTPSSTYTQDWVYNVASTGIFIKNSNATWNVTGRNGVPTGWTATINYLRFTALENGSTLQLKKWDDNEGEEITPTANVEYSWDGLNFSTYNYTLLEFSEGQTIYLRGSNPDGFSTYNDNEDDWTWHHFTTPEGSFECHGNIMSLLYGADFETSPNALVIPNAGCFFSLFYDENTGSGCNIICAPELPAIDLSYDCYGHMFNFCGNLITAPELPATTLAQSCYEYMFNYCTSLTIAPVLPATTLAINCYGNMFTGCTRLITAPELPATTLARYCYCYMFAGCTSLTTAPVLPATTLAEYCYQNMFSNCTSLTTAPELPATTLAENCYRYMFYGCSQLNYIKAMFTTTPSGTYTLRWVDGVASSGTFVKNSAAQWTTTGNNGIPTGWTVQTASE